MESKSSMHEMYRNRYLSIPLILIFSISLFFANAFAGGCDGDEDCFNCNQIDHHATGPETGFMPYGCQPGIPDNACGITASPTNDNQDFLISTIRVDNHEDSGITADPAVDPIRDLFSRNPVSSVASVAATNSPPIYLSNLSFLC
jgi:hypothetical protein